MRASLSILLCLFVISSASASTTRFWSGAGGNGNWSTSANWVGNVGPSNGDAVMFDSSATGNRLNGNQDIPGLSLASLEFASDLPGAVTINLSQGLTVGSTGTLNNSNHAITLNGSMSVGAPTTITNDGTATFTVGANINLGASTLTLSGTGNISLTGILSGGGGVVKNGNGKASLSGANTFSGSLNIDGGTLAAQSNDALGDVIATTFVSAGATLELMGNISIGAEPLNLNGNGGGAGALVNVSGNNTFGGPITLAANTLIGVNSASTLTLGGTINGAFDLTINNPGTLTLGGSIGGGSSLKSFTMNGTGTTTLSGGGITTSAVGGQTFSGRVVLGSNMQLNATSGDINFGDTVDGGFDLVCNTTGNTHYNGIVGGSTRPTKVQSDAGGETRINGGEIKTNGPLTLNDNVVLNANTLLDSGVGDMDVLGSVVNNGFALTISNSGSDAEFNGVISGAGLLTMNGSGTLTLTNNNSYGGVTNVNSGTVVVINSFGLGATGSGTIVNFGAALELQFNVTISEPLSINGSGVGNTGALRSTTANTQTVSGPITLAGPAMITVDSLGMTIDGLIDGPPGHSLTKDGSGPLTIGGPGSNTFTGQTIVKTGELSLTKSFGAIAIPGNLTIGDGFSGQSVRLLDNEQIANTSAVVIEFGAQLQTLDHDETVGSLAGSGTLDFGAGGVSTFTCGNSTNTEFSGDLLGPGGVLVKVGTGELLLSGVSTFSGDIDVTAGALRVGNNSALGDTNGEVFVSPGATLAMGSVSNAENISLNGATLMSVGGNAFLSGDITLSGGVTFVAGNNDDLLYFDGEISGTGGLTITGGNGHVKFAGTVSNIYSGTTTVNASILELDKDPGYDAIPDDLVIGDGNGSGNVKLFFHDQIFDGALVTINASAKLDLNDYNEEFGNLSGAGTLTLGDAAANALSIGDATNTIFTGVISGTEAADSLVKQGIGSISLVGANTFACPLYVTDGIVIARNGSALGTTASGTVVTDGATLEIDGGINVGAEPLLLHGQGYLGTGALRGGMGINFYAGAITLATNVLIGENTTGALHITGVIGGPFDVGIIAGAGTVGFRGANSYTGTTMVNTGIFEAAHAQALGGTTNGTVVVGGATLQISGGINIGENLQINGSGTTGGIGAIRNISGFNTLSGTVALSSSSTINVAVDGESLVLSGVVSGAQTSDLTKTGPGTLKLTAANTYAGKTTASAGVLKIANSTGSATGTGAVNVNANAILAGFGTVSGAVTMDASSILSPDGDGATVPIATLTTGALSLDPQTLLTFDFGVPGTSDLVAVNGNLTLNGQLHGMDAGGFAAGIHTLFTYTGAITENPVTVVALPGGSSGIVKTIGATVKMLNGASIAPVLNSISASTTNTLTDSAVTFTADATDPNNLPLSYIWDFGDATALGFTNPISHAYASEGTFVLNLIVDNGFLTASNSISVSVLGPNSGGQGVPNVSEGAPPVTNPLTGITTKVISSNGGVLILEINLDGLLTQRERDGFSVSTDFDGVAGKLGSKTGTRPVQKFTDSGVFVASSTATEIANNREAGKGRKTLVISESEVGKPARFKKAPVKRTIEIKSISGKFNFGKSAAATLPKNDTVTLKARIELPEGLDLSKAQPVHVGIGNIVDSSEVDGKGKQTSDSALKRVKKVKVKMPKLEKGKTETAAGQMADVDITLSLADMSAKGFNTEGIAPTVLSSEAGAKSVKRKIQTALVIGGVSYESTFEVDFKLSKNKEAGTILGKGAR
ncbi:MAG TPA: autotransporter-associated beta strand repeat-containing protein [Planctomycetota bacterium]|nr:autotransporter-associated beta strand repeat-containing protein [Planctomycetota bacterium]